MKLRSEPTSTRRYVRYSSCTIVASPAATRRLGRCFVCTSLIHSFIIFAVSQAPLSPQGLDANTPMETRLSRPTDAEHDEAKDVEELYCHAVDEVSLSRSLKVMRAGGGACGAALCPYA